MIKLCIDPGHGFGNKKPGVYDPGTVALGHQEADIALQWALTGKWCCQEAGIKFFLTRDDDSDTTPVGRRDDRANAEGCTHFISLHCNAPPSGHGTETFYRDNRDLILAKIVQSSALSALGLANRGVKHESDAARKELAVFGFDGPCALLEIGFLGNRVDLSAMLVRDNRIAFWRRLIGELKAL